jgi:alkylation response protein AidB-like acyl-CoA dehydrogenase
MFEFNFTEEEKKLRDEVREFVKSVPRELLMKMEKEEVKYPKEFLQWAGKKGLLGLRFPEKWGGRALPWTSEIIALEEIGLLGNALACLYSLVSIVGEAIDKFGSDEQKEQYLKPMLEGKLYTAEALTEPRGGSDFFGATTFAERKGDYYILNGQKRFIVGAEGADFFLVYVKTEKDVDPKKGLSVFIVERDMGVKVETIYELMGTKGGGTGRIVFKDVKVPAKNIVGKKNMGATIFNQMMIPERMTSAAGAIGLARAALEIATRYSNRRKAFGQIIRRFQGVNFRVADAISALDAARGLVYFAARAVDLNAHNRRRMVSEAKKVSTETAWEVINHAMQIMGGIGYTNIYPIEKYLRDARLTMIWTGTNEIMNLLIQHEYYKEVLQNKETSKRDVEKDALMADMEEEKVYE